MPFVADTETKTGGKFVPDVQAPSVTPAPQSQPQQQLSALRIPQGVGEAALNMATGILAKPAADVATLGKIGADIIHPQQGFDPAQYHRQVMQNLTYAPRTPEGDIIARYNPMALLGQGVGAVSHGVGSAISGDGSSLPRKLLGAGVEEAINQAPAVLGAAYGARARANAPATQAGLDIQRGLNEPLDTIRNQSQQAGLITPIEGNSWLASMPGVGKLNKIISAANQARTNSLTAEELGLPKGVAITDEELSNIREKANAPYRAVIAAGDNLKHQAQAPNVTSSVLDASGKPLVVPGGVKTKTGFVVDDQFRNKIRQDMKDIYAQSAELPETFKSLQSSLKLLTDYSEKDFLRPATVMRAIGKLRKDASTMFKSDDPVKLSEAFTSKAIANELEDLIERNLAQSGNTKLLNEYRDARQLKAKTYAVQSAIDNTGNVNVRKLYLMDKKSPGRLSDNLKLLADFGGAYPEAAQKVSGMSTASPWDWLIGAESIASGHPGVLATQLAGKVGVPGLAKAGMMQKRTPSYQAGTRAPYVAPAVGILSTPQGAQE